MIPPIDVREALESILASMEQMPQLNEAIVEEIMRGDHTLECKIGGDEANISSWVAIARMALSPNEKLQRLVRSASNLQNSE